MEATTSSILMESYVTVVKFLSNVGNGRGRPKMDLQTDVSIHISSQVENLVLPYFWKIAKMIDIFPFKIECERPFYGDRNVIAIQPCFVLFYQYIYLMWVPLYSGSTH